MSNSSGYDRLLTRGICGTGSDGEATRQVAADLRGGAAVPCFGGHDAHADELALLGSWKPERVSDIGIMLLVPEDEDLFVAEVLR